MISNCGDGRRRAGASWLAGMLTTAGSTNALQPPSSSMRARANDTAAEPRRMMTSWSLNCSSMSSQRGVGGSSGIAVFRIRYQEPLTVAGNMDEKRSAHHCGRVWPGAPRSACSRGRRCRRLGSWPAPSQWDGQRRFPWRGSCLCAGGLQEVARYRRRVEDEGGGGWVGCTKAPSWLQQHRSRL